MTDSTKPTSMRYRREVNVANNTLASILERYNGVLEQVIQRIDILEKGQKLDRTGRDMDTDDFEKLQAKVRIIDEKTWARLNDIDERLKAAPGGDIGAQMLEVIDDNGRVNETLAEISREAARDVIDNFDFEYHHVENAVEEAVDRIDLSDSIDWDSLHASQFDTRDFAECISEETPFREALRSVDDHEDRLDTLGDQMCMVIGMLERIGIATEPSSHTELFGDKRSVHQTFGDLVAKMSEDMSPDDRAAHLNLIRDTVAENVAKGVESEE